VQHDKWGTIDAQYSGIGGEVNLVETNEMLPKFDRLIEIADLKVNRTEGNKLRAHDNVSLVKRGLAS
jgi:hypothetical protein